MPDEPSGEDAPHRRRPLMFGRRPSGPALTWDWADSRLREAGAYWLVTVDPPVRPRARPVWGIWTGHRLLFSTASRALHNIGTNAEVSVHLESASEVVILEGTARIVTDAATLHRFVGAYNAKYGWDLVVGDGRVSDSAGNSGAVVAVRPTMVVAWPVDLERATAWQFQRDA